MAQKTVTGSCHCKAITYEAQLPADLTTVTKCNCTMCQKPGMIHIRLESSGKDFKLLTPDSISKVPDYQYRNPNSHRYFCDKCGVQVWGQAGYEINGVKYAYFGLNLNTIDQPQDGFDASTLKPVYIDGLNDNQRAGGRDVPYPGGSV